MVASFELVWKDRRAHPDQAKILRSERLNIEGTSFRKAGTRQRGIRGFARGSRASMLFIDKKIDLT
jgi:hypothetical protein